MRPGKFGHARPAPTQVPAVGVQYALAVSAVDPHATLPSLFSNFTRTRCRRAARRLAVRVSGVGADVPGIPPRSVGNGSTASNTEVIEYMSSNRRRSGLG